MKHYLLSFLILLSFMATGQQDYFYPEAKNFDPTIPTPEKFLGYPIGFQHTRHDKIVEYFKELDRLSDRVTLRELGTTYENRVQITAFITSPDNHKRLEEIRTEHLKRNTNTGTNETPLVILLGYNVHGNEPSSSEAALLTAYYLTASQDPETINWLNRMVIMVDPVYNPDGRDRHTNWANMHKSFPPTPDPADREHNEVWPGGRTNHYWFDLNRDWFLAIHPESKNRLKLFHEWRPYVMTDHHEMGTTSTFYFDPGKYSSNNPIVPAQLYDALYPKFGEYFAGAMNKLGSQYFTKEAFDKLYPGYGSSYVNFFGGAGFLFEQASSRGHVQNTPAGPVTFAFTIRNQFVAGLTTVRASLAERENLINLRINFYKTTSAQAKANPVKGYVFGDKNDANRTNALIDLLLRHQVEIYEIPKDMSAGGKTFEKGSSYLVPTEQENYLMVRSAFEKDITYTDSIFYDASTWSLVHAFNMPHAELRTPIVKGNQIKTTPVKSPSVVGSGAYAYLIELTDYNAHRAIWQLQQAGVVVKTAFRPFTTTINGKEKKFGYGTLIIPVSGQPLDKSKLETILKSISSDCNIDIHSVETGYNVSGIDLGSNFSQTLRPVKAIMLMGNGIMANEAGETWHLLDQRIGMPITKVDVANLGRVQWSEYNVLIMVNGNYNLDKTTVDRIRGWLQSGGTLITFKGASEWAIRQGLAKQKLVPQDTTQKAKRLNFEDAANTEGARSIGGSIFQVDLDLTSPIGFGFTDRKVSVYRNGLTFLQPSKNPYTNTAVYTSNPLIGGYLHKSQIKRVANSAAILINPEGQGRIILFADNPNFRGIWYGTNKLFLNALFFGPLTSLPQNWQGE
ncbi:MAG: M14 family zinc carboxypeptidase [Cyclobacteriaceae bacterium]